MIYCGGIKLNVNCESSASTFVLLGAEGKRGGPLSWVRYIFLRARPLKGPTKIPAVDWLASAEWSKQARFEFVPENDTTGSQRGNFWGGSGGVYLLRCRVGGFCANLGFHENNCLGVSQHREGKWSFEKFQHFFANAPSGAGARNFHRGWSKSCSILYVCSCTCKHGGFWRVFRTLLAIYRFSQILEYEFFLSYCSRLGLSFPSTFPRRVPPALLLSS